MVLNRFRKSLKAGDELGVAQEEYIEVDVGEGHQGHEGKIGIRIESVKDFSDTERVLKYIRAGDVVMLKIKVLREKDLGDLKRAVDRLKRTILAQNGDIVGVEEDWLLLVPEHAVVHR